MTKQEAIDKLQEMLSAEVGKAKAYSDVASEYRSKYYSLQDAIKKEVELNGASGKYLRLKREQNEMLEKANDNSENAQNCHAAVRAYYNAFKILCEVA